MAGRVTGVGAVIAEAFGTGVRVTRIEELAHLRGAVVRVTFHPAVEGVGRTVVVKRRDADSEVGAFAATNLATEEAALRLLALHQSDVAPRLVAGGADAGYLVMTDVGTTIEAALFGDDLSAAEAALIGLAAATARLHLVEFDPTAFAGLDTWTIANREHRWDALVGECAERGLPLAPTAAVAEREALVQELRSPGPIALVHGDLGPNNAVVDSGGTYRLVDFEGAGYQHIGLDAAMLRFPFAWYGRWAPLAPSVQARVEKAYRTELGWPATQVDDAIAVGSMAMALLRLERLPRIADRTQAAAVALRRRSQMVATIDTAVEANEAVSRFPELVRWLRALSQEMRVRWSEARQTLPTYPALRTDETPSLPSDRPE